MEAVEVDLIEPTTLPSVGGGSIEDVSPRNDGVFGDFIQGQDLVEVVPDVGLATVQEIATVFVQGTGGGQELIAINAAEDLAAFSMVTADGHVANSANTGHYGKVVGITSTFVASGFVAQLFDDDEVDNPLWSWSVGQKLFLNGITLSTTPPSSGFCQMVAVARNPTTVIMRIEIPILL